MFAAASVACLAYAAYKWVTYPSDDKTDYRELGTKFYVFHEHIIHFLNTASKEAVARNECYDQATKAYKRGEKKLASTYSERGKNHDAKMREYNKKACGRINLNILC